MASDISAHFSSIQCTFFCIALVDTIKYRAACRHFVCMHSPAIRAGFERRSLQVLTGILLGKRLSKKQQCSNWGREDLSVSQVQYAATDAWESRKVALKLQHLWLPGVEAGS